MMSEVQTQGYPYSDEAEGIELVNRRIAQIQQLRGQITQLVAAYDANRTRSAADQLSVAQFRLYEARFMLDRLVGKLKRLQRARKRLTSASTRPYDARTAGK